MEDGSMAGMLHSRQKSLTVIRNTKAIWEICLKIARSCGILAIFSQMHEGNWLCGSGKIAAFLERKSPPRHTFQGGRIAASGVGAPFSASLRYHAFPIFYNPKLPYVFQISL